MAERPLLQFYMVLYASSIWAFRRVVSDSYISPEKSPLAPEDGNSPTLAAAPVFTGNAPTVLLKEYDDCTRCVYPGESAPDLAAFVYDRMPANQHPAFVS